MSQSTQVAQVPSDPADLQRELNNLRSELLSKDSQIKSKDNELQALREELSSSLDKSDKPKPLEDRRKINPVLHKKLLQASSKTTPPGDDMDDDEPTQSDEYEDDGSQHSGDGEGNPPPRKKPRNDLTAPKSVHTVSSSDEENEAVHALGKLVESFKKKKQKKKTLRLPRYAHASPHKNEDKLCSDLQEGAPELLETLFRSVYSRKEIKETLEHVERPANCEALHPVMINKKIYSHMSENERKKDEPLKFIANAVAKASQPLATVWNQLLLLETNLRENQEVPPDVDLPVYVNLQKDADMTLNVTHLMELLDESLKILGMATSQIAQKRRLDLKYKLAPDCKDLAKRSQPFTSFIFGDNIKASALENRKERAISYSITHGKSGVMKDLKSFLDQHKPKGRGQSYTSPRPFRQSSQFRGRGRGQSHNYNQSPQNSQNCQSLQQPPRGQSSTRGRGGRGHGRR